VTGTCSTTLATSTTFHGLNDTLSRKLRLLHDSCDRLIGAIMLFNVGTSFHNRHRRIAKCCPTPLPRSLLLRLGMQCNVLDDRDVIDFINKCMFQPQHISMGSLSLVDELDRLQNNAIAWILIIAEPRIRELSSVCYT
jgi:hypothetical protein